MIPKLKLSEANRPKPQPGNLERSLAMLEAFKKADDEYRQVCAEKGIPYVPLVCKG